MRAKHREIIRQEAGSRLEKLLRTMPPALQYAPWLHPKLTHAEVRRTIQRLRTGAMRSPNPEIPDLLLADLLEGAIEKDIYVRSTLKDIREYRQILAEIEARQEDERRKSRAAYFNRLKKSPEANDPESPAAERVRRLSAKRRRGRGDRG